MAELICPSCGTANPSGFVNCRVCKSLLYGFAQPSQSTSEAADFKPLPQGGVVRRSRLEHSQGSAQSSSPQRMVRQSRHQFHRDSANRQGYGDLILEEGLEEWVEPGSAETQTPPAPPPAIDITVSAPAALADDPATLAQQAGLGEGWEVVTDPAEQQAAAGQTIDFQPTWEPAPVVGTEAADVPPEIEAETIAQPSETNSPAASSSEPTVRAPVSRPAVTQSQLVPWRTSEQPAVIPIDPCNQPVALETPPARIELPEQPVSIPPIRFRSSPRNPETITKTEADIRTSVIDPAAWFKNNYKAAAAQGLQLTDQQRQYSMILESVILNERHVQPIETVEPSPANKWLQWIVSVLVLASIIIGLLSTPQYMRLPRLYAPENVAFFNTIQQIQKAGAAGKVFIAMDLDPKSYGEMKTVFDPVVRQLLAENPSVALISSSPAASILGVELLTNTQQKPGNTFASRRLLNLGYIPTGSAGLAGIASDLKQAFPSTLRGNPAWSFGQFTKVEDIRSFDAVILVTDNSENARLWVEQVQPSLNKTPFLVISTAQAAPMLQPYIQSGQIHGAVSGINGAATFAQIAKVDNPTLRKYWDIYQLGILGIALILVVGLIATFTIRAERPRYDEGEIW